MSAINLDKGGSVENKIDPKDGDAIANAFLLLISDAERCHWEQFNELRNAEVELPNLQHEVECTREVLKNLAAIEVDALRDKLVADATSHLVVTETRKGNLEGRIEVLKERDRLSRLSLSNLLELAAKITDHAGDVKL